MHSMPLVILVAAAIAFAIGIVVSKPAIARIGLRGFLLIRVATGLIGTLGLWWSAGRPLTMAMNDVPLVIISLLVCPIVLNMVFFAGVAKGAVGPVNALRFTAPLWATLFAAIALTILPSAIGLLALLPILIGVILLVGRGAAGTLTPAARTLGLIAGASQGGAVLLQQAVLERVSQTELLLYQNVLFAIVLLGWWAWSRRQKSESNKIAPLPGSRWLGVTLAIISGLAVYVVGEYLKFQGLTDCPGAVAVAVLQLSLPVSTILALGALKEYPTRRGWLGITLISTGSVLAPLVLNS